jgi:3-methyladenine DNA glycosylase/8-oxoguanine DNA glycosylase
MIFGDSADNREFENEDAYQYWSKKEANRPVMEEYEEMQEKIKERLKNFKDYDDFLKNFENHREKHEHRAHLFREEGFKELNDKYDPSY